MIGIIAFGFHANTDYVNTYKQDLRVSAAFSGAVADVMIAAVDINNNILNSLILDSGDPISRLMVSDQIGRIEIAKNSSDTARFNAVDDSQVNNAALPDAIELFPSALLSLFAVNRNFHNTR